MWKKQEAQMQKRPFSLLTITIFFTVFFSKILLCFFPPNLAIFVLSFENVIVKHSFFFFFFLQILFAYHIGLQHAQAKEIASRIC